MTQQQLQDTNSTANLSYSERLQPTSPTQRHLLVTCLLALGLGRVRCRMFLLMKVLKIHLYDFGLGNLTPLVTLTQLMASSLFFQILQVMITPQLVGSLFFQILQVMITPQLAIDLCTLIPKGKVILQADTVPCITIQRVMTIPRVVFGLYPLILQVHLI